MYIHKSLKLHRSCLDFSATKFFFNPVYSFLLPLVYLLAIPLDWNVTIGNTSRTSIRVHWENLAPLIDDTVLYYIANAHDGNLSSATVVPGNSSTANVLGLSTYTEYQVSVMGINRHGQPYNSSSVTVRTEEGGVCYMTLQTKRVIDATSTENNLFYYAFETLADERRYNLGIWYIACLQTSLISFVARDACVTACFRIHIFLYAFLFYSHRILYISRRHMIP